jgi:hypothetical protein
MNYNPYTINFNSGLAVVPKKSSQTSSSTLAFSQTASKEELKQRTSNSNQKVQTKIKPGSSSTVVPYNVYNNSLYEKGGRKKKPVSKPKNKKMTSPKKKQIRK